MTEVVATLIKRTITNGFVFGLLSLAFLELASSQTITGITPTAGPIGLPVTISGSGFGATQGTSTVSLNGVAATATSWSDSTIVAIVPIGSLSGLFSVTVNSQTVYSNSFAITALPAAWSDADIGAVGIAGSAVYSAGSLTVKGSGSDIWGTSDQFNYAYQSLSGDGTIVARVASVGGGKAGVMIRETLTGGSTELDLTQYGTGAIQLLWRSSTGASTNYSQVSDALPYWLKLSRSGNNFSAYRALDGQNWVQVGSTQTITMATNVYIGLAVTSINNNSLVTSTFDNVSVSPAASPAPAINSVSASTGSVGSQVIISGSNFGTGGSVMLNGLPLAISSWSSTSVTATIVSGVTTGYLVVSAAPSMNASNAIQFEVTSTPLPSGWVDQDVGPVGVVGSATYSNGTFTVKGSGTDIYGTGDQFHFVYQLLNGDGTIVARVVSLQNGGSYEKVGVMIRETLTSGSTEVDMTQFQSGSVQLLYRSTTGGSTGFTQASDTMPHWVKMVRSGSNFSGYISLDGENWVQVGSTQTITMATNVYIGLAVASTNNAALMKATFDNVAVNSNANPAPVISSVSATTGAIGSQVVIDGLNFGNTQSSSLVLLSGVATTIDSWSSTSITATIPSGSTSGYLVVLVAPSMDSSNPVQFDVTSSVLPPDWVDEDVGAVGVVGSATYSSGTFTVKGSGVDIYGTGDQFHFVYQPLNGDGSIVARVVSLQGGGSYVKAGVMIRETLTTQSTEADMSQFQSAYVQLLYRATTGGSTSYVQGSDSLPYWMKMVRIGNSFSGYISADGQNWVQVGATQTISMATNVYVGLAVSSTSNSALLTATFDHVSVISFNGVGGGIWGTVSNANGGSAISGAQITISQWNTTKATAWSDINGHFAVSNLPEGAYDVTVSASGFGNSITTGIVVVPYTDTTLNLSLNTPGSISGKVTQADGVTPITGAAVQAAVGAAFAGSTTTDSGGNFTIGGLNAENYQVQASANGYTPNTQSASVTAGSTTTLSFALEGPGSSSGGVSYTYDPLGRLVGVIDPSGNAATYTYDAVGNLLSISRYSSSQLSIMTFSPVSGPVGTAVMISGTGFSTTAGQNTVQFSGVGAVVQSSSATQLVVMVPNGATSGTISVTTSVGTATSNSSFTVTSH